MESNYTTERLKLSELSLADSEFMQDLVNTPEWIRFIGDRNIKTEEAAKIYVQNIIANPSVKYWVVKLISQNIRIGIITFIKRDYLEYHDIGFAFLPQHVRNGYACEASLIVLNDAINKNYKQVLATTIKENRYSIKLLEKLGLSFERELEVGKDLLMIYSITADKFFINEITKMFFSLFTNAKQRVPILNRINEICLPETIFIKQDNNNHQAYNINTFINPRQESFTNGTLTEFEEYEVFENTGIVDKLAQRFSKYQKKGYLNGKYFETSGNKFFQYIKTKKGWRINSVIWEDEDF